MTKPSGRGRARGPRHGRWAGDNATYYGLHQRVRAARGKPVPCCACGASGDDRLYEWANLTGNYADVNDYQPMCVPCHRAFDRGRSGKRVCEPCGLEFDTPNALGGHNKNHHRKSA